jgi:hypothetical protein
MEDQQQPRPLRVQLGPVQVDFVKTAGYYGGIMAAVAAGMIEWPLAIFIAGVPFYKLLQHPDASLPVQVVSDALDGAARPVGGSSEGVIKLKPGKSFPGAGGLFDRVGGEAKGIWDEARRLAG